VRFEEEDVSVLGGDLRLASFEAGEAVAVWWWCGGQHGDARSVCLSLCLSLTCSLSLSLSPDPAREQRRAMVVACGGGLGCPAACVAVVAAGSVNGGGVRGGCGCREREWRRRAWRSGAPGA
jgi:hypothetical protein